MSWKIALNKQKRPDSSPHPFLGREVAGSQGQQIFETDLNNFAYLQGHKLGDVCLCPLTAYLEMALAGGIQDQSVGRALALACRILPSVNLFSGKRDRPVLCG